MRSDLVRRRIKLCINCDLSSRAGVSPVPYRGPVPAQIAIVGEAPGFHENVAGRPFVKEGSSGLMLRKSLDKAGINIEDCFVCNTVSCFPDATPTVAQQKACRVHLKRQLQLAQAPLILCLGAVALNFFDPDRAITKCHGQPWRSKWGLVFPTFHPAGAMRNPEWHTYYNEDMNKFGPWVESHTI